MMFTEAFEIFLYSLAYSFWPFVFVACILYLINRYFNDGYKKRKAKAKKITGSYNEEEELLAAKALSSSFKPPKIETSFGDQRIGDVHHHEEKD
jgi:purine-cytosine permease-like protein